MPAILQALAPEMSLDVVTHLKDVVDIFQIQQMNEIISSINAEYKKNKKWKKRMTMQKAASNNNCALCV